MAESRQLHVASVAFIIAGRVLNLQQITEMLKVQPTHTHRVGDPDMLGRPLQHDMWRLESGLSAAESLSEHLEALRAQLVPAYDYLKSLKATTEMYVYCGLNCDSDQCGFSLTPGAVRIASELDIDLEITVLGA